MRAGGQGGRERRSGGRRWNKGVERGTGKKQIRCEERTRRERERRSIVDEEGTKLTKKTRRKEGRKGIRKRRVMYEKNVIYGKKETGMETKNQRLMKKDTEKTKKRRRKYKTTKNNNKMKTIARIN